MTDERTRVAGPILLAPFLAFAVNACGEDGAAANANSSEVCGGFGVSHDGHCHCNAGYQLSESDDTVCEPIDPGMNDEGAGSTGRLLISDGASGRVVVVDLALGEVVASLHTQGPARVYPSSDGLRGFAIETSAGAVEGINAGVAYFNHGDHWHPKTSEPRLFAQPVVSCPQPIHFVTGDGRAAAFCDGDGMLYVFEDTGTTEAVPMMDVFDSGRPHHGVGLVALDHVILSSPNPNDEEDALPVGVRMLDFQGTEHARYDSCPGLHGEASTDTQVCFGCSDGVLCIHSNAGQPGSTKIQNPADTPEGIRIGRLAASESSGLIFGNWGTDLARIDPITGTLSPLPIGEPYLSFALTEDGLNVLVLTLSGYLRKFDAQTGAQLAEVVVMPAFELESGHSQLRPSFVVGAEHAYVVDPRHPEVYELTLETLQLTPRALELEAGQYHSLALVGIPPAWPPA